MLDLLELCRLKKENAAQAETLMKESQALRESPWQMHVPGPDKQWFQLCGRCFSGAQASRLYKELNEAVRPILDAEADRLENLAQQLLV